MNKKTILLNAIGFPLLVAILKSSETKGACVDLSKSENLYLFTDKGKDTVLCTNSIKIKCVNYNGSEVYSIIDKIWKVRSNGRSNIFEVKDTFIQKNLKRCFSLRMSPENVDIHHLRNKKRRIRIMNEEHEKIMKHNIGVPELANVDGQWGKQTNEYFKCFLDKARENLYAKEDEMSRWVDVEHKTCYCSEENSEPCNTGDISNSNFIKQLMRQEICDVNDGRNKNDIFIVMPDYSIITCNNFTGLSKQINQTKLYNYCRYGLSAWDNRDFYEYLNCDSVSRKRGHEKDELGFEKKEGDYICIEKCKRIRELCNGENSKFYNFEMCKLYYKMNSSGNKIYNDVFKYFHEKCTYFDPTNRGLLLCKEKRVPCEFSEWSTWSVCTKSCKEDIYDSNAIRIRKRHLIKNVKYVGKSCNIVVNNENKLVDVNFCTDIIPYCKSDSDNHQQEGGDENYNLEKKLIPPFIIPLTEIEKANTLNELNEKDNDVMNDNLIHEDSEVLTKCVVTDMHQYEHSREYSEKIKSCACPPYHSPCYFKDIYESNYWRKSFDYNCKQNPNLIVLTADFVTLNCSKSLSIKRKEIAINTYLAMTFDCRSATFRYLFCSKSNDSSRKNIFYIIFTCLLAFISALYFIHIILTEHDKWSIFIKGIVSPKSHASKDIPSSPPRTPSSLSSSSYEGDVTHMPSQAGLLVPTAKLD
ncbi:hypothetical protein, conserved [Plasmodium gonderi]|uniref:Thrombospondin-related protein 1 n=1 Tax=Plasmodium gonderi TaxID=77519 RepID=A0A1Y1JDB4_PLAGO|nr:hypothetical protein, conserved [Plasmodium gonderi]GAW79678.1 hypothetical protein, conserved [Plasmodium gonderi]